jgi:hypothetical protein
MQHFDLLLQYQDETHLQHPYETSETLETYSCNMGFAWTNGGTPARRLMATHGPCCEVVHEQLTGGHRVTRISSPSHACWSIRRGGGHGEEATWWRRARQTGLDGEYGAEEAIGDGRGAASIEARGRDERIGSLGERRVRE